MAAALVVALPGQSIAAAQSPARDVAVELKSSGKVKGDVGAFYKARNYRPLWTAGGVPGPEADRLLELIATADLDGLDPEEYKPRALAKAIGKARGGSPEAVAKAEFLLSRSFAAYVRDVRRPRQVGMVYLDWELVPERPTARAVLEAAAAAPSLMAYLEETGWTNPYYAGLRKGLARHLERWRNLPQVAVPPGPALGVGAKGERVRILRLRLGLPDGGTFDKPLAAAVREFKAEHGLPRTGLADAATIAALNQGSALHEWLMRINLERARALPADLGRRHIVVDAAAARLWVYEDGEVRDTMRVIVGKPTEQTPMLAGLMRFAMVNPYWNVPPDLVQVRIARNVLDKGVSYLGEMGYELLSDWSHDPRVLAPDEVDWPAVAAGRQELRVRQLPGKGNMMGKMKFMFPNDLGIYLHDTPDKTLFKDPDRRFSSGCVRVEDAARLAKWLFGKPLIAQSDAPEERVNLPEPVPVYITYLTAMPTERGIAFREDAYARDQIRAAPGERALTAAR